MSSSSIRFPRSSSGVGKPTNIPSSSASSTSGYLSNSSSSSSSSSSDSDYDSDEDRALIQEEWEESLRQIQALVSIVIMPFFGRWYGRKWSFWAYDRYRAVGLTRKFLGI